MAGADSGAVVAMEVLIEQQAIAPVRVILEFVRPPEYGPPAVFVSAEDGHQARGKIASHLEQRHGAAGAGRAFDLETISEVLINLQQGPDDQYVDGKPHRASPVRVAAKHPRT